MQILSLFLAESYFTEGVLFFIVFMKLNTLVIDDDPKGGKVLSRFVALNPRLEFMGAYGTAIAAHTAMTEGRVDVLICRIELADTSGIEFVKNLEQPPLTVFVSAFAALAVACFEVGAADFLLEPFDYNRFMKGIERIYARFEAKTAIPFIEPYFFVREKLNYIQIAYKDVLYIKAKENFVQIVTNGQSFLTLSSITQLAEKLDKVVFLRVHRSYIVQRAAITLVNKQEIILTNGQSIPVGEQYRTVIHEQHIDRYNVSKKG